MRVVERDTRVRRSQRTVLPVHIVECIRHLFILHGSACPDILRQGLADLLHIGRSRGGIIRYRLGLLQTHCLGQAVDGTKRQVQFATETAGVLHAEIGRERLPEEFL